MKKLLFILLSFGTILYGHSTVVVGDDGAVLYPSSFVKQNDIVPKSSLSVFVDLYSSSCTGSTSSLVLANCYTDCVLKVLDPEGNLLYFFSTIMYWKATVQSLHSESIYDNDAKVYYYPTGRKLNSNGKNALRPKTEYKQEDWDKSIAAIEKCWEDDSPVITAIQIYPSSKFHSVFLNPENSIICHRQSIVEAEVDKTGNHLFRPAMIQYLR